MSEITIDTVHSWNATYVGSNEQLIRASNSYSIEWNGVTHDHLSLTWLLMLVCIRRAEAIEAIMVQEMEMLQQKSVILEGTCAALDNLMKVLNGTGSVNNNTEITYTSLSGNRTVKIGEFMQNTAKVSNASYPTGNWSVQVIEQNVKALQDCQDSLNEVSQKTAINIEALVNKRDQVYLLNTTCLKRFFKDANNTAENLN